MHRDLALNIGIDYDTNERKLAWLIWIVTGAAAASALVVIFLLADLAGRR